MIPTNKLRFVERVVQQYGTLNGRPVNDESKKIRVLQQYFEPDQWNAPGEWRDVPLVEENT